MYRVPCPHGCLRTPLLPPAEPQRCDQRALWHRPQARDAAGAGCPPHLHHRLSHPPQPEGLPQERGVSPSPSPHATAQPSFVFPPCAPAHSPCITGVLPATFLGAEHEMPWEPSWSWPVAHGLGSSDTQPLVPPQGCVRPLHADIQLRMVALPGLAGIFAARPGSFPWEPGLIFHLASKGRRRQCGCVISAHHQAVHPWLQPSCGSQCLKSMQSPSVQAGLAQCAQGGRGGMAPREDPKRGLGICPASLNLTRR